MFHSYAKCLLQLIINIKNLYALCKSENYIHTFNGIKSQGGEHLYLYFSIVMDSNS